MLEANKMVLKESPIFYLNFSDNVIQKTVSIIREKSFSPYQDIYLQNEMGDQAIYFIEKGTVEIYMNQSSLNESGSTKCIRKMERGACFGQLEFFTSKPPSPKKKKSFFFFILSPK